MQTFGTTKGMYYFFLDGIRKEYTNTVPPDVFNRIINEAQLIWLDSRIAKMDQDEEAIKAIAPVLVTDYDLPTGFNVPENLYRLRVAYASFKDVPPGCNINRIRCRPYKHNVAYEENPFRKPGYKNPYIYEKDGKYIFVAGDYEVKEVNLTYIRIPRSIYFDSQREEDLSFPLIKDIPIYTPGTGSVPCEFHIEQRREIVDTAVRIFLERRTDPRYQSFLQEQLIRGDN